MKTLKYIVLLTVMLVNVTPYIKDGKLEWKTTHAQAQAYTIEHLATNKWLCKDESFPLGSQLFISPIDCDLDLVCACGYCKKEIACDDTCKNMNCPDKIRERICPACNGPLDINNKCINCNCYNSDCYEEPTPPSGGGGGYSPPDPPTILPGFSIPYSAVQYVLTGGYIDHNCDEVSVKILKQILGQNAYVGSNSNKIQLLLENSNGVLYKVGDANTVFSTLNAHLAADHPIMIGVNHTPNRGINENATDHFVVITGRFYDYEKNQYYFKYIETAHWKSNPSKAVANDNRLYYDSQAGTFIDDTGGSGRNLKYTLTQIRPNLITP